MSNTGVKLPLDAAREIAVAITARLLPFCDRIQIAGSIRRGVAEVGDIELVVIPRTEHRQFDLFDQPLGPPIDCLHEALCGMLAAGEIQKRRDRGGRTFWGASDKRILWIDQSSVFESIPVDLFGSKPLTWGWTLAHRTGPADVAHALVTAQAAGGLRPNNLEFDQGLWRYDGGGAARRFVPTPEEADLFRELELPWTDPADRSRLLSARVRA